MQSIGIAVAQTLSINNNISYNIAIHQKFIKRAAEFGIELIIFPELSLCGYELELAKKCLLSVNDPRLAPLRQQAIDSGIIIIAGAPVLLHDKKMNIANLCFFPDGTAKIHIKRYLHKGEERYFSPGNQQCFISLADETIAQAICADITNPQHPQNAAENGSTIYLASVLITPQGYKEDANLLQSYALKHNMAIFWPTTAVQLADMKPPGKAQYGTIMEKWLHKYPVQN